MPGSTSCSTTACSIRCCWRSHIIRAPLSWLSSDTAVYIGIVYSYLPFMVLPLYATLEKMDETLLEAAADLGCTRWTRAFWLVTLPLSLPGVAAGVLLCFIPIVGEFVIPDLLGGSQTMMIGQTLWTEFFSNRDWPVRFRHRGRAARAVAGADRVLPAPAKPPVGGLALMRRTSPFNIDVDRARASRSSICRSSFW